MRATESPAVARRRIRLALRAAREANGFTQSHVAEELDWSLSKVNRIEKGDVTVSRTDLLALLDLYGISDQDRVDDLVRAARTSRQRGWWDEPNYREHLTSATLQLIQFESEASVIRVYQPTLIPGMLQTTEYAEFIMNFWQHDLSEGQRMMRLESRAHRREHVLEREDPPDYLLILDESALVRQLGGVAVMAGQLRSLLEVARRPNVRVRVLPFEEAAILALLGPFTLMDLGEEENAVLYRESVLGDSIDHTGEVVRRHRRYFEHMWEIALTEEASRRQIEARATVMLASLDRKSSR
jgi:transcriptional regulator with XRE-family HTH domain